MISAITQVIKINYNDNFLSFNYFKGSIQMKKIVIIMNIEFI